MIALWASYSGFHGLGFRVEKDIGLKTAIFGFPELKEVFKHTFAGIDVEAPKRINIAALIS